MQLQHADSYTHSCAPHRGMFVSKVFFYSASETLFLQERESQGEREQRDMAPKRKATAAAAALSQKPAETAAKHRKSSMTAKPKAKPASSTQVPCPYRDMPVMTESLQALANKYPPRSICKCMEARVRLLNMPFPLGLRSFVALGRQICPEPWLIRQCLRCQMLAVHQRAYHFILLKVP